MMCIHGDSILLRVPIPAALSATGEARWADKPVDRCLAPVVAALNAAGIYTAAACCGHGKADGSIVLHDGRELVVRRCVVHAWMSEAAARVRPIARDPGRDRMLAGLNPPGRRAKAKRD